MNSPDPVRSSVIDELRNQIHMTPLRTRRQPNLSELTKGRVGRLSVLATATVALAALAIALVLSLGAAGTPAAYAVTPHPNGTVTITLRQLTGIKGLNKKLKTMGLHIRAVPVVRDCHAPVRVVGSHQPPATLRAHRLIGIAANGHKYPLGALSSLTVETSTISGHTLVLAASKSGLEVAGAVVKGHAPACVGTTAK